MKNLLLISLALILFSSCETELVKWEFSSNIPIKESGSWVSNGLNIRKSLTIEDFRKGLKLEPGVEIQSIKIISADLKLNIVDDPNLAENLSYELTTNLIPIQKGTTPIKAEAINEPNYNYTVKLPFGSLDVVTIINTALKGMIATGASIDFSLFALPQPSGTVIPGNASLVINFNVVYWKCVSKPELTVLSDANKGLCN